MASTTTKGAQVAEGLPEETNGIGDSKKNDRDRITLSTGNSLRVHRYRWSITGKIWISTNQITAISAGAHVPREVSARALSHLGVYKESQSSDQAIRVRVSLGLV